MHLITKKALIASTAQRFADAFLRRNEWPTDRDYTNEKRIHAALLTLPNNPAEADVTAIIGHNRFTRNSCHQCGIDSDLTVALGHEKNHMLDVKYVCPNCLEEAVALVSTAK